MTDLIKAFMSGELDASSFTNSLKSDEGLRREIDLLVPKDAINNPSHNVWKCYSYDVMKKHSFSLSKLVLQMGKFDGSLGDNLNMFSRIQHFYVFSNPDVYCTSYYDDIFDFYLDIKQDCFEGKEVSRLVEDTLTNLFEMKPKSERNKRAKEEIRKLFHVEDKKRPKWIQGAAWPMGKCSPMKYVERKKGGEYVDYYFADVDTGEERVVRQWY